MSEVSPGGDPGKEDRAVAGLPVIPALDGFRAYAILGIVLFHLLGSTALITSEASRHAIYAVLPSMVEVLFIISGFVVFLPTVARNGEFGGVRSYALRRAARLIPAYWLSLVVVLVFLLLWPGVVSMPSLSSIGIHGAFAHVPASLLDRDFLIGFGVDAPVWTLSLEIIFYALLPLVAVSYFRHPLWGLAIAALITIAWKQGTIHLDALAGLVGVNPSPIGLELTRLAADNQFPAFAFCFALGMTAAWLYVWLRDPTRDGLVRRWAVRGQLLSLLALLICGYLFGRYAVSSDALFPVHLARRDMLLSLLFPAAMAAFLLTTSLAPPRLQLPFASRSSRILGDISYGIYLIHFPMILFVAALLPSLVADIGGFWVSLLIALPLTVAYGWASARFVEQPIRRWARRYGRRSQKVEAGPAARPGAATLE